MKRAIVLDIDENLVHSIVKNKHIKKLNDSIANGRGFRFQLEGFQYYVFKRPGLDSFLKTIFKEFDYIGFWTTGVKPYARNILKHILTPEQVASDKLIFIYTRQDCMRDKDGCYYKPLSKIWNKQLKANSRDIAGKFKPNNTIMMDNTLLVMKYNLDNALLTPNYDEAVLSSDNYLPWLEAQIKLNIGQMNVLDFVKKFSLPKIE